MYRSVAICARQRLIGGSLALATCLCLLSSTAQAAGDPRIHLPGDSRPKILDQLKLPQEVQALAVSPDGNRAAVAAAVPSTKKREVSAEIRVVGVDGSVVVTPVQGHVRDLLFVEGVLFGILHRPAKRHEGDASLVSIDLASRKAKSEMRLPASARDIESWDGGRSLLVSSRNEIRTITLPLLRSGPLYRVPGENLSIAVLGGNRILIGQDAALLLVDLADPQERESMPIRERLATTTPVVSLALTDEGKSGLAGLADGRVVALTLAPLALDEVGSGLVVSRDTPTPPVPTPAPPNAAVEQEEKPSPKQAPPVAEPPAALVSEVDSEEPEEPAAAPREQPLALEPPPTPPAPAQEEPAPAALTETHVAIDEKPAERQEGVQLRGHIDGPGATQVVAVVALGPDSLLREAARVAPGDDRRWVIRGLAPGRYRIQLDGGGTRALITQPPFRHVEVTDEETIVVDFRVLRAF